MEKGLDMRDRMEEADALNRLLVSYRETGDQNHFEALYRQADAPVRHLLRAQFKFKPDVLDDVMADAWAQVVRYQARFDARQSFHNWFYSIARNAARRYCRCVGKRREVSLIDEPDGRRHISEADILGMVGRLPDAEREVIQQWLTRKSCQGVADSTGIALGTVKYRLHNARGLLRRDIEEFMSG